MKKLIGLVFCAVFLLSGCIISITPGNKSTVSINAGDSQDFTVNSSSATIAWTMDDALIPSATGTTYTYSPDEAEVGDHVLVVSDGTGDSRTWNITVVSAEPEQKIFVYRDNVENILNLPVTQETGLVRNNAYSVGPITVPPNSLVEIDFQCELTNNLGYNVGVGRQIIRTTSAASTTGTPINPAVMSNSTPDEHHYVLVHHGMEVVGTTGLTNVYYNVPLWLVSTSATSGATMRLEPGYGELIIKVSPMN
jgi:hypothetical protein